MTEHQLPQLPECDSYCTHKDLHDYEVWSAEQMREYALAAIALASPPVAVQEEAAPPFGTKRAAALALYRPPFRFTHGYIYDAANQMVADQDGFEGAVETHIAARVRGWGRIGYLPDAAALQDEVGQAIADALTAYWSAAMKGDKP